MAMKTKKALVLWLCAAGALLAAAEAASQNWRAEPQRSRADRSEKAPFAAERPRHHREHRHRHHDHRHQHEPRRHEPRRHVPRREPPRVIEQRLAPAVAPAAYEMRDPLLARCDAYSQQMENVIRAEMAGGGAAGMERLRLERQAIYQAQLRAGC